ncbi:CaiB/BaiF CoA-transferase family protein [Niveibacterium sp. COAC-50]|uniref:CaiB/BaiF CoA transferase family protein n=1 Tax=Niveibacterium sp. COAC-50 TaxID=2729384 RepID=UPI001553AB60|nr:CaiB/BaiF CoA-transferase family protein [Niveibacterium sp. COAC-50]
MNPSTGPLAGVRVIEIGGIGPAPFCGMLLADMGADVALLERSGGTLARQLFGGGRETVANRGKRSLGIDLKAPGAAEVVLRLLEQANVLIEGFRPGVMERLGLGPDVCAARNPRLIYARMTGWGQTGPLAPRAGHDLNYAALSGALDAGRWHGGAPWAPPSLLGDMGGGGMMLAFGIACALLEARHSGRGQVIDAAMTEGAALLAHGLYNVHAKRERYPGIEHILDSTAPFYDVYACADGKWLSVAPLEPQFYTLMLQALGLEDDPDFPVLEQYTAAHWPRMRERLAAIFAGQPRDHWTAMFADSDACIAPVLDMDEAPEHPHLQAREAFIEVAGIRQPAPAPRLSATPASVRSEPPLAGEHTVELLRAFGFSDADLDALLAARVIEQLPENAA